MIHQELNELYWLNKEIEDLEKRIKELEATAGIGASKMSGMPSSGKISNPVDAVAMKILKLRNKIQENKLLVIEEKLKIEEFIGTVEDSELRMILRLRNIDLLGWEEIGDALGMDRTTASRKYRDFIESLKEKIIKDGEK